MTRTRRNVKKGQTRMTPGHEALVITAFTVIALLSIVTFVMVSRYRKSHTASEDSSPRARA